jgi:hypothetical protein
MESISEHIKLRIAEKLFDRERLIIEQRLGIGLDKPASLSEIGQRLNVSRERVRQLQNKALRKISLPEVNALLLTSEITNPGARAQSRWGKRLITRVEEKYGHINHEFEPNVKVWLSKDAPSSLSKTLSRIHTLPATWARVDGARTIFLDDDGEIYGNWPTEIVDYVKWPNEKRIKASRESHAERMEKVKEKHPRAWSPWSKEEDSLLINEFKNKSDFDQMCATHERAPGGINARLKKLDLIPKTQNSSQTRKILRSRY